MPDDTTAPGEPSDWSLRPANGYCGPGSVSMLIETVSGHHVSERQVASWAIHNGEVTALAGASGAWYGMLAVQAASTLNALGGQFGIEAAVRFGSIGDLESDVHHGLEVIVEIDGGDGPGRFVVLTGVDAADDVVHLNDPGAPGRGTEAVSLSALRSAWSASNDAMIVISCREPGSAEQPDARDGPVLLPIVLDAALVHAA